MALKHQKKDEIIKGYGDFKDEGILKRQARIGQIFSGTKFIDQLKPENLTKIEDIEIKDSNGKVKYCFSDGCGKIDADLSRKICQEHGLVKCSAFQVRIGGIKGVLSTQTDDAEVNKIEYRPS